MTAEPDLLPCPFCGSENIDPKGWASTNSAGPACDDCGASAGGVSGTLQDNIARWNTRACVAHATAAKNAEIEALRAEVERVTCELMDAITRADKLEEALRNSADALERLAFAIRAPNAHTPQLVELAIAMRAAAHHWRDR